MSKILRILGREGRTTIPFELRMKMRIAQNDIISFEAKDNDTIIIKREKLCTNCCDGKQVVKETSLLDVINSLNLAEQREVLRYLAKKLTEPEIER
jgi:bifunctional DNA-binding transcriptional regulator/antitoxin component of YhaV-PrlF toxin-antitoxin module